MVLKKESMRMDKGIEENFVLEGFFFNGCWGWIDEQRVSQGVPYLF